MSSSFGTLFRVATWGESHGPAIGCTIDGCPAGLALDLERVRAQMARRRPGQSKLVTPRREDDHVEVMSGIFEGLTTGTPIALLIRNGDVDSSKYEKYKDVYRPSHADYTYDAKYGVRDWRGGGRASARETAARVAAGAIAEQLLAEAFGVEIVAWVSSVEDLVADVDAGAVSRLAVDAHPTRCPDAIVAEVIKDRIELVRADRDSVGGVIDCVVRGLPAGLGEPVFDKAEALLGAAMLSIPAAKGFESGSGFGGARLRGSAHNDLLEVAPDGSVVTTTNRAGGIVGGITNGMPVTFRVAFKPVATLARPQPTINRAGEPTTIDMKGRHDPCVVPRAVPVVEAMAALVFADLALRAHLLSS